MKSVGRLRHFFLHDAVNSKQFLFEFIIDKSCHWDPHFVHSQRISFGPNWKETNWYHHHSTSHCYEYARNICCNTKQNVCINKTVTEFNETCPKKQFSAELGGYKRPPFIIIIQHKTARQASLTAAFSSGLNILTKRVNIQREQGVDPHKRGKMRMLL